MIPTDSFESEAVRQLGELTTHPVGPPPSAVTIGHLLGQ